ncbi:MAG: hypothetical protein H6622_16880 [Halobacteriovoraceae bacterium]|nr:hypothetical protein [Halobacteriovoraceae bacterium]
MEKFNTVARGILYDQLINRIRLKKEIEDKYFEILKDETVQELAHQTIPIIESLLNRTFKRLPIIKVMESRDIFEFLYKNSQRDTLNKIQHESTLSFKQKKKLLNDYHYLDISNMKTAKSSLNLPFFFFESLNTIVVNRQLAIQSIFERSSPLGSNKLSTNDFLNYLIISLGHELVHVLQSQYSSVISSLGIYQNDFTISQLSLLEGHATFFEEKLGEALGISPIHFNFIKDGCLIENQMTSTRNNFLVKSIYLAGKDFVEYFYNLGGVERVWKLFDSPPQTYSEILDPQNYTRFRLPHKSDFNSLHLSEFLYSRFHMIPKMRHISVNQVWEKFHLYDQNFNKEVLKHIKSAQTINIQSEKGLFVITIYIPKGPNDLTEFSKKIDATKTNFSLSNKVDLYVKEKYNIEGQDLEIKYVIFSDGQQYSNTQFKLKNALIEVEMKDGNPSQLRTFLESSHLFSKEYDIFKISAFHSLNFKELNVKLKKMILSLKLWTELFFVNLKFDIENLNRKCSSLFKKKTNFR